MVSAELRLAVQVMLACNDPDNGNFAGECDTIEIPDLITVEGPALKCQFIDDGRWLRLEDQGFMIRSHATWVGNWCWDQVTMSLAEAGRLLRWLHERDWTCTEAEAGLFDAWHSDGPIASK